MYELIQKVKKNGLALWEVARVLKIEEQKLRKILMRSHLSQEDQETFEQALTEANYRKYGHIDNFISDTFYVTDNTGFSISATDMYDLYVQWVHAKDPERFPLGNMLFGRYLGRSGIEKIRTNAGYRYICLKRKCE